MALKDIVVPGSAFSGGLLLLLDVFYYLEQLSFSKGLYYGVLNVLNIYNNTPTSGLIGIIDSSTAVTIALYASYILIPFALIIFTIGTLWLFSKSYTRNAAIAVAVSAVAFMAVVSVVELNFGFSNFMPELAIAYIGGVIALVPGSVVLLTSRPRQQARRAQPIHINPDTPYSNIRLLSSRLMGRLSGDIRILDMHFDSSSVDNLARMSSRNLGRYASMRILTKKDRLGGDFDRSYIDFKNELGAKGIGLELRILDDKDAAQQHERMIMDGSLAYKIPPLNIINRKSEHIVSINHKDAMERFERLWTNAAKYENLKEKDRL
ncbi:MAG: hypothetical protein KGH98_03620 [Candidatus Micrarchaeota archaeon]|nr:hypothetical protein [Candidatus Micrarchaeota archaeon]